MYMNQEKGKIGESLACEYLRKNKYNIIERNFYCRQGEIDIIAFDRIKKELVFIEVKTRTTYKYGRPCEAVDKTKRSHICSCIKYYTYMRKIKNIPIRIDVIEVYLLTSNYKINHIKKAFL